MKNKKIVAAVAAVAAAAICLIAVLAVKLGSESPTVTPAAAGTTAEAQGSTSGYEFPSYTAAPSKAASETPAAETSTAKSGEKITEKLTDILSSYSLRVDPFNIDAGTACHAAVF